jgi:uncharacterized protein YjiS (DUF1127 family)
MAFATPERRTAGPASALTGFVAGVVDAWRRARVFRATYAELDGLTARQLDDLGISRSMITRLAYEAAYGPKSA